MTTLAQRTTLADPVAVPQMNAQERLTFIVYAVLGTTLLAFLLVTSAFWLI
jgi:hypothetical protein